MNYITSQVLKCMHKKELKLSVLDGVDENLESFQTKKNRPDCAILLL